MAKQLTLKQKKNKYRILQYTTFVSEFISIMTPFIVMGIANAEDWFYTEGGWKVGLGGTLALALLGIAVFLVTKKKEDDKITGGYITLVVGWFAVTFIFILLGDIINQISTIMIFGGLGLLGAFGFDIASKSFKAKADMYLETIKSGKQKVLQDQFVQENQNNDIRF